MPVDVYAAVAAWLVAALVVIILLAWGIHRTKRKKKWGAGLIVLGFLWAMGLIAKLLGGVIDLPQTIPSSPSKTSAQQLEAELQKIPFYREIKGSDPQTYERMQGILRDGTRKGQSPEMMASRIRSVINQAVATYIPHASDNAVIDYATAMIRQIEELNQINPELCYGFVFREAIKLHKHLSKKSRQDALAATTAIIRTATHNPQPSPDASQSVALLEPVYTRLHAEYGDDLLLLDNPLGESVDKNKVCTMTAAMFKKVLDLPKKESGMVLRYMFSAQ